MWWLFKKKKSENPEEYTSIWKEDFSDCVVADFLPTYSVCQSMENRHCRYVAMYSGMTLCSHPDHKSFIPKDAVPFDPHKGQF